MKKLKNKRVHFEEVKNNGLRCIVDGVITENSITRNRVTIRTKINDAIRLERKAFLQMIESGKAQLTERTAARMK